METYPRHWLDFWLWPVLRYFWEPLSEKGSYWWHWRKYEGEPSFVQTVSGDPLAGLRYGNLLSTIYQTSFGWKRVAILEPMDFVGPYQIGYASSEQRRLRTGAIAKDYHQELCSIVIHGKCAALVGPDEISFFAVAYHTGLPIRLKDPTITSKEKLEPNVVLV